VSRARSRPAGWAAAAGLALAAGLAIAALADLGPFDEPGGPDVGELPAAASCPAARPAFESTLDGGPLIPRRADGRLPVGFNDGAYLAHQATPAQSASMQRGAGSGIWRGVAAWQAIEAEPGSYDFASTDRLYCAALAAGIAPLFAITASPRWAADPAYPCAPRRCTSPPLAEHYDSLTSFAAAVAARYPDAVAIEAWNEPNLELFWAAPDPERYVEVLEAIHDGVRAADPSMPVLMGGLSDVAADAPAEGDIPLGEFLNRSLDAGAGDLVDAFNVHLYPQPAAGGRSPALPRGLSEARAVLAEQGEGDARIWITETGIAARGPVSRREQARALVELYRGFDRAPDLDAALFHTLVEPNALIVGGRGYGWVSQRDAAGRFHPYPAYCAFARLLAEPVDCAAPLSLRG
jgi:Cellulase (glycosyl hydrolase family 5)